MNYRFIGLYLLIVLFSSCSDSNMTIFLKADNADGLEEKASVYLNGLQIARINKVSLDNDFKIIAEVIVDQKISLPIDTKFKIFKVDIMGTRAIDLTPGTSNQLIKNKDTVRLESISGIMDDSLTKRIEELILKITGSEMTDTLIAEIERLNSNLEQLKKEIESSNGY